jgi:hypothetical protein
VSTCTRTGVKNLLSPRFLYAELKANGCTSLTDSLYSQITGQLKVNFSIADDPEVA